MPSDSDTDEVSSPSSPAPQEPALRLPRARAKSVRLDVAPDIGAASSPARAAHSRDAQQRSMSASFSRPTSAASSRSASRTTSRATVRVRPRKYSATFGRRRGKRKSSEASRARVPSGATSGRTSPDEQQEPAEGQDGGELRRARASLTRRFDGHRDMGMVRAVYRQAKRSFQLMREAAEKEAASPDDESGSVVPDTATETKLTVPVHANANAASPPAGDTPSQRRNLAAAAWKVVAAQGARPRASTEETDLSSPRPSLPSAAWNNRSSFNSCGASEPASPNRQPKVPLPPAIVSRLGMKAMVKAVRTMNFAMLLIEESQHKVAQRKAMENMETKSLIQAGDWQSIEGILKQTAEDVAEKADDPEDASCVRLREALNEAASRAQKLSVLQGSVGDLAPLIQAIPDALAKIKSQIRMNAAATAQAQQSAAEGGGGGTLASEPKEVKRMLAAVLEAENLLEKTRSMRGSIESSVRSLNEGLGELGCLPPPTCVMGHTMTWRALVLEGKVFCERCSVPRVARDGIAPWMWCCEECARENRRFHFCKECGDCLQDELVIQKCAPSDWEQLMKIADEALASTHMQLAACPATATASAGGNHSMADMLQDLRREVHEMRNGRRRSVRRRSSGGRLEEESVQDEHAFARRLSRRLSRASMDGEEEKMSRRASSARRASSMGSTAAKQNEESQEEAAALFADDEAGAEEEDRASSKGTTSGSLTDGSGSSDSDRSSSTSSSSEESSSDDDLDKSGPDGDRSEDVLQSSRAHLVSQGKMGFSGIANLKTSARRLLHYAKSGKGQAEGGFASVVSAMAAERGEVTAPERGEVANLVLPSSARTPRRPLLPSRGAPGTATSSLGSAKLQMLLRRTKKSEAEMQLEQLRREVLALGPPERILTPEPLPQPCFTDFSSGSPSSVLSAAVAISGSRLDEQPLPTKLLLPPLKPIKAYIPATAAANLDELQQSGNYHEEAGCLATARQGLPHQWQRASPRSEPLGWKGSRLGSAGSTSPPGSQQSQAHALLQNSSSRVSTAREIVTAEDGQRRSRWNTPGTRSGGARSRDDDLISCKTVAFSGGFKVRGKDPMAGGLFAREAVLDTFSKERGIYQGQLHRRYAASPALELTAC